MSRDESGPYHHLIAAEREAAEAVAGQTPGKIELIKRLREATGLDLRRAKDAVEAFLAWSAETERGPSGWVDDFLDAERAAAARADRPVTRTLLVRALQGAPGGFDPRMANQAVADYLRRRGASLPRGGGLGRGWLVALALLALIGGGLLFLFMAR